MKVNDIFEFLNEFCPFDTACDFDNAGLLIGDKDCDVTGVVVALDCTEDVINEATKIGAELIITHHPVIFSPLKSVTADGIAYRLIKSGISVFITRINLCHLKCRLFTQMCTDWEIKTICLFCSFCRSRWGRWKHIQSRKSPCGECLLQ